MFSCSVILTEAAYFLAAIKITVNLTIRALMTHVMWVTLNSYESQTSCIIKKA